MQRRTLRATGAAVWLVMGIAPAWAVITIGNGSTVNINSDNFWLPTTETVQFNTHNGGYTVVTAVGGSYTIANPIEIGGTNFGGQRVNFDGSNNLTFTNDVKLHGALGGNGTNTAEGVGVLGTGTLLVTFSGNVYEDTVTPYPATLVKYGAGTLALTGASSYSQALIIAGGAVRASDGVGLPAGTPLRFDGGVFESQGIFNRSVGTGTTQVMWGNNPSSAGGSGGFAAYGGPLTVDLNTLGSADTFTWNSNRFMGPGFGGPYTLKFGSQLTSAVVTFVDNINLNGAVRTIEVTDNPASDADRAVIAGNLTGTGSSGLDKAGGGTLVLAGASNSYAGVTTVSAGTLLVNGSLNAAGGTVTVAPGAALGGTGTISRLVDVQGGTVAPGASAGTLTVSGLLLDGASFLDFELGDPSIPGASDRLQVNGALTLDGTLNVAALGGFGPGTYRLIDYTGSLTDNGLLLGTMPAIPGATYLLDLATAGQVNFIVDIPEPGTGALLLLAAAACRRRRRA